MQAGVAIASYERAGNGPVEQRLRFLCAKACHLASDLARNGRAICRDGGQGGQLLHAGDVTEVSPTSLLHWYEYKDGRTSGTGSINAHGSCLTLTKATAALYVQQLPGGFCF